MWEHKSHINVQPRSIFFTTNASGCVQTAHTCKTWQSIPPRLPCPKLRSKQIKRKTPWSRQWKKSFPMGLKAGKRLQPSTTNIVGSWSSGIMMTWSGTGWREVLQQVQEAHWWPKQSQEGYHHEVSEDLSKNPGENVLWGHGVGFWWRWWPGPGGEGGREEDAEQEGDLVMRRLQVFL